MIHDEDPSNAEGRLTDAAIDAFLDKVDAAYEALPGLARRSLLWSAQQAQQEITQPEDDGQGSLTPAELAVLRQRATPLAQAADVTDAPRLVPQQPVHRTPHSASPGTFGASLTFNGPTQIHGLANASSATFGAIVAASSTAAADDGRTRRADQHVGSMKDTSAVLRLLDQLHTDLNEAHATTSTIGAVEDLRFEAHKPQPDQLIVDKLSERGLSEQMKNLASGVDSLSQPQSNSASRSGDRPGAHLDPERHD